MRISDWSSDVCSSDLAGRDLATAIAPFCRGGSCGGFFAGKASFALDDDFTVFEMSDLASREELRSVVLSAIMFMTSQAMTRSSRATKKLLLIDEAWAMLKGGSMGEFVETYARTARKYGGALATATQPLNDYYKSSTEERRSGKECVRTCKSRGWPD